ncbi:MAG: hypothetical protein ACLRWQ_02350 [Flavonifractor plautii]
MACKIVRMIDRRRAGKGHRRSLDKDMVERARQIHKLCPWPPRLLGRSLHGPPP